MESRGSPRSPHGSPCFYVRIPCGVPRILYGVPMESPWLPPGSPAESPWIPAFPAVTAVPVLRNAAVCRCVWMRLTARSKAYLFGRSPLTARTCSRTVRHGSFCTCRRCHAFAASKGVRPFGWRATLSLMARRHCEAKKRLSESRDETCHRQMTNTKRTMVGNF